MLNECGVTCNNATERHWPSHGVANLPKVQQPNLRCCRQTQTRQQFTRSAVHNVVTCYDLHEQIVPYTQAWAWQQHLLGGLLEDTSKDVLGSVILLQHPPILTLGAGSTEDNLLFNPQDPPLPLFRTERGGEATYHGPGQLVVYPIFNLQRLRPDLHWYLRSLEEVLIRALKAVSGIQGKRCNGLTGVWVGDSKVAAIGIRARRWVTYHGLALNVTTELQSYRHIIPCGISDRPVTSVAKIVEANELEPTDPSLLMDQYAQQLLQAVREVFNCDLRHAETPLFTLKKMTPLESASKP